MRQAERAASQSEATYNRGRSEFRGTEFGAKKAIQLHLPCRWMERGHPEVDGQQSHTGSESAVGRRFEFLSPRRTFDSNYLKSCMIEEIYLYSEQFLYLVRKK